MIMDVFLNGVAMMIAICIVVMVFGFVFWAVARIVRWVWRPELMAIFDELFSLPDVDTWCQGCDELVSPARMAFTDGWRYRCEDCRRPRRLVEDVKAGRDGGQVFVTGVNSDQRLRDDEYRRALDIRFSELERQRDEEYRRGLDTLMRAAVAGEARKMHQRWMETQKRWVDMGDDE